MAGLVIVASAPWEWDEATVRLVLAADEVLAADGGANHLARIGVRPALVVGDLDSIRPEVRAWIGEDRIAPRPDQDFTDLHKTLLVAFDERGAREVTVLAATGGRLDHAVENLCVLARFADRGEVELRDRETRIFAVRSRLSLATTPGQAVSLLPLGRCARVTTVGLAWPLTGEPLDLAGRTGVSNRADGDRIEVAVEGGTLLVFLRETP
jgi:thiamine pyrophosphokinase